ncbi:MAG: SRPBCC family protein [Woeseiaceae bacterium]
MQKLMIAIGGFVVLLVLIGLTLPQHARVVASIEIDARPATVFALVNDFDRVVLWSPWLETDPNARVEISGDDSGVGAKMSWDGLVIGRGSQVIATSEPFNHIGTLINPGESAAARSWFDFSDTGTSTVVDWTFETDYGYNLVGRYTALLLNGVIRRDYEHGLQRLAELAESLPRSDFSNLEVEHVLVTAEDIAFRQTSSLPDPASTADALGKAYFRILNFIDANALQEGGAPMLISKSFDGNEMQFDAAIPIRGMTDETPTDASGVKIGKTYEGPAVRVRHRGPYRSLVQTHRKITAYLAAHGIDRNGNSWESFINDPTTVAESDILTDVFYPIGEE